LFPVTYGDQDVVPGLGLWLRYEVIVSFLSVALTGST